MVPEKKENTILYGKKEIDGFVVSRCLLDPEKPVSVQQGNLRRALGLLDKLTQIYAGTTGRIRVGRMVSPATALIRARVLPEEDAHRIVLVAQQKPLRQDPQDKWSIEFTTVDPGKRIHRADIEFTARFLDFPEMRAFVRENIREDYDINLLPSVFSLLEGQVSIYGRCDGEMSESYLVSPNSIEAQERLFIGYHIHPMGTGVRWGGIDRGKESEAIPLKVPRELTARDFNRLMVLAFGRHVDL